MEIAVQLVMGQEKTLKVVKSATKMVLDTMKMEDFCVTTVCSIGRVI